MAGTPEPLALLTEEDVRNQTFGLQLRGYRLDDVDRFLDRVAAALRTLERRASSDRWRIAELEDEVERLRTITRDMR